MAISATVACQREVAGGMVMSKMCPRASRSADVREAPRCPAGVSRVPARPGERVLPRLADASHMGASMSITDPSWAEGFAPLAALGATVGGWQFTSLLAGALEAPHPPLHLLSSNQKLGGRSRPELTAPLVRPSTVRRQAIGGRDHRRSAGMRIRNSGARSSRCPPQALGGHSASASRSCAKGKPSSTVRLQWEQEIAAAELASLEGRLTQLVGAGPIRFDTPGGLRVTSTARFEWL